MKKSLFAGLAATALIGGSASAADLARPVPVYTPPPPVVAYFTWTGCYVGANGGGLWSSSDWTNSGFFFLPGGTGTVATDFGSQTTSGGLGGLQVGCNYQAGGWVFGIQGDYDWSGAKDSGGNAIVVTGGTVVSALSAATKVDSLASVTGRVGYSWDRFLGYVKGGGAWVKDEYTLGATFTGAAPFGAGATTIGSVSNTRGGWTVGVGAEYAFLNWLTGFIEYDYYRFSSNSFDFNCAGPAGFCTSGGLPLGTFPINVEQNINVLKVGVNLKFGG